MSEKEILETLQAQPPRAKMVLYDMEDIKVVVREQYFRMLEKEDE